MDFETKRHMVLVRTCFLSQQVGEYVMFAPPRIGERYAINDMICRVADVQWRRSNVATGCQHVATVILKEE